MSKHNEVTIVLDRFLQKRFGKDYLRGNSVIGGMIPDNLLSYYQDKFYFIQNPNIPDLGKDALFKRKKDFKYSKGFYFNFNFIKKKYSIYLYSYIIIPTKERQTLFLFRDKSVKDHDYIVYDQMHNLSKYTWNTKLLAADHVPNTFVNDYDFQQDVLGLYGVSWEQYLLDGYERIFDINEKQLKERVEALETEREAMRKRQVQKKQWIRTENKRQEEQRTNMEHQENLNKKIRTENKRQEEQRTNMEHQEKLNKKSLKLLETKEHFLKGLPPFIKIVHKRPPRYPYYFLTIPEYIYKPPLTYHANKEYRFNEFIQSLKENHIKCSIASNTGDFNFKYVGQKIRPAFEVTIFVNTIESLKRLYTMFKDHDIQHMNIGYKISKSIEFASDDDLSITKDKFLLKLPKYINEYKKLNQEQTAMAIRQEKQSFSKGLREQLKPFKKNSDLNQHGTDTESVLRYWNK